MIFCFFTHLRETCLPNQQVFLLSYLLLIYFCCGQYRKAPEGSARKIKAQKQFSEAMSHRMHLDNSIQLIGKLLFGIDSGSEVLRTVRPAGEPLVDDWLCLKTLVILAYSIP